MRWVTAQDLQSWATRLDAESRLPELVRRLVRATLMAPQRVSFPSGESVQLGGWDGIVIVGAAGNEYVPDGTSGWELSRRTDVTVKANDDYEKRTADPEHLDPANSTYVFVTPRRFNTKDDWVAEKQARGEWRDVRALDANDLEQWLEQAPAVGAWLARALRIYPNGVLSSDDFWAGYSRSTDPAFAPELLLAGRNEEAQRVSTWLKGGLGALNVAADSPAEAFAFVAASITLLSTEDQDVVRSRLLFSDDLLVLRELITTGRDLIIGWQAADTTSVGLALQQGHRVLLHTRPDQQRADGVTLGRPSHEGLVDTLKTAGLAEDRAEALVREAAGSLTVLHRRLCIVPTTPLWARPEHARELVPALLGNAWDEAHEQDKTVVAELAGTDYGALSGVMARWSHASDAPVQQTGSVWTVRSPRDAWTLLSAFLTREDLERLHAAITAVLGLGDPSLELAANERWLAAVHNKEFPHSTWLRRGLAQTLIQVSLTPAIAGMRGSNSAAGMVHGLLGGDWRRWYALSPLLHFLAEASPAIFLDQLEAVLDGEGLGELFAESGGPMGGDHTGGLLWALEVLAWYPEHLTRTARCLAVFAREHKQPRHVLRAIFLTWKPQTSASVEDRTTALRHLIERETGVGWELLMDLWPKNHDVGSHHSEPVWREKPSRGPVTMGEYHNAAVAIVNLALEVANNDPERLVALIEHVGTAPPDARVRLHDALANFAAAEHDVARRALVWNALREELSKHRQYQRAAWALPAPDLALFDPLLAALQPEDLVSRHAWLFQDGFPTLPIPGADHRAIDAALADLRPQAVAEILATRGTPGVRELALAVSLPFVLGLSCAAVDEEFMLGFLASPEERLQVCGMGYVSQRFRRDGTAWVDHIFETHDWDKRARAAFLLALPTDRVTWDRVSAQDVVEEYWERTRVFLGGGTPPEDIEYALTQLLAAGQIGQVFEQAAMTANNVPTALLVQTLDRVLEALQAPQPPFGHLTGYYVVQILGALDARADADLGTIARLEWAFLPLLRDERNLRLHEHLSNSPHLFAQMVQSIYAPPGPQPSEEAVARAHHASDLLHSWHTIPGTTPNGGIDGNALRAWADAARIACADCREACDTELGKVLAWSPNGADGQWPHESVRSLIEHLTSPALEDGFRVGVWNKCGMTTRHPLDGGAPERALSAQYREWGGRLAAASPRTSAALLHIGDRYEAEAHREDVRAEQLRLRWQ